MPPPVNPSVLTAASLFASPSLEDFSGRVSDSGEGRWTAIAAIEDGVPAPVLPVLAGVEALLPRLVEDGYLLGIVTGNLEAAAHIKLRRAAMNRFFSFGGYGSDSTDRGELTRIALQRATLVYGETVTPEQAIAVGDTPHDVEGAHAAGMECVGVGSHHFGVEPLREASADYAIASLEEALPL